METSYLEKIQIHKTNPLAGLHPNTKFLVVGLYSLCSFVLNTVPVTRYDLDLLLIPWFFVLLGLFAGSGSFLKCMKAFKAVAFVAVVIFLVQTFIVPGGDLIWRWGFLRIYEEGLQTAISLSCMVINVAGIFVWLLQTTQIKEVTRALEEAGLNYKATYVFTSSLQMIQVLSNNSTTIMNAQRARGIETDGNLIVRAKAFFPTLVPLVLGAVVGAEERVLTLEARGFSVNCEKTHLFNLERSGAEGIVKACSIGVTAVVIIGRIVLWII